MKRLARRVETLAPSNIKVLTPSMLRTSNEEVEEQVEEVSRCPWWRLLGSRPTSVHELGLYLAGDAVLI